MLSSAATPSKEVVQAIAGEMAIGIERAVDCWMAEIDLVLADTRLTTLGRLYAVKDVVERYKKLSGKKSLEGRVA